MGGICRTKGDGGAAVTAGRPDQNRVLKRSSLGRDFIAEICPSVDYGVDGALQTVHLRLGT